MGETKEIQLPAGGEDRLRLSAWADPKFFLNLKGNIPFKVNGTILRKDAALSGKDRIDDISLLKTFTNDTKMNVKFELGIGNTDDERRNNYNGIIDECHAKGIQCLVGFAQIGPGPKTTALNNWLRNPTAPTIDDFADKVVDFALRNFPLCDGISFDIEGLASRPDNTDDRDKLTANLTAFYQAVATKIGKDRMVGIATGGLISPTEAARLFDHHPDGTKTERPGTRSAAMSGAIMHAYEIGLGHPNILIRPMAYDNFKSFIGKKEKDLITFDWHEDIIDYVLHTVKLPPSQFQLGIKTIQGLQGAEVTNPSDAERRCKTLIRVNRVGMIFFPVSESFWSGCAQALNPRPQIALPLTLKQPVQFPLNADMVDRMVPLEVTQGDL